jgi:salicylate hydroxylase
MDQQRPIIIVGGGIGGLTMALALARKGLPSIVLEQAPQLRETGAGIQLCPNVFKMFEYLEIIEPMKQIAVFPDNLVYVDGINGCKFLTVSLGEELLSRFKYPYGVFHREELLKTLAAQCLKYPEVAFITDAKVTGLEELSDRVVVTTEKGQRVEGEIVIGCDGLWSVVRSAICGEEKPRFSKHVAYRGVIPLSKIPGHLRPNNVVHWVRDNSHLVHYPIGSQGFLNIVAIIQTTNTYAFDDIQGNPTELTERFAGSQPEILELLKEVNPNRKWLLFDRDPITHWSKGRMTLVGDSAHPTLPYLTQGAGLAIEDAVILAERLVEHQGDYQAAFKEYQEERYLRAGYVQLMSRAYGEAHHSTGVARELRDMMIAMRTPEENYEWLAKMYQGIDIHSKVPHG